MGEILESLISFIPGGNLTAIGALIVAALGAIWGILARERKAGKDQLLAEQKRKDDETRKKFEEIDKQQPDLDSSLDRLRRRSGMPDKQRKK